MALERRKTAGEAWETVEATNGGSQPLVPVEITFADSPYTASVGDLVLVDPSADSIQVIVPETAEAGDVLAVAVVIAGSSVSVTPPDGVLLGGQEALNLGLYNYVGLVCDGTNWEIMGQGGGTYAGVLEIGGIPGTAGSAANINFSAATIGTGRAIYIGQVDESENWWEIGFQGGFFCPEVDTPAAGISLGHPSKPWGAIWADLPTSNPGPGGLWNDAGTVKLGT